MKRFDHGCRDNVVSRRGVLRSLAAGSVLFPGILSQLLAQDAGAITVNPAGDAAINPLAPRAPHFAPKAKRVIFLYMSGGVSHMDSFDPKPKLYDVDGKTPTGRPGGARYLRPFWDAKPGGKCGT